MNRNDHDEASNAEDYAQSNLPRHDKDSLSTGSNIDITQCDKTADLTREQLISAREESANIREHIADLRDGKANLREQDITSAESLQAETQNHVKLLQQANAHLVIATIEAHKMAEQIKIAKDQLAHMAYHDALTGLPNRILLLDRLRSAIELATRQGWQLALMYMDLDQFKHINDSLGHVVGDRLLLSVAHCLASCARHSDTISRQGGDEFLVLLPFIEHTDDAALCAKKMIVALDLPHCIDDHDLHISVSIGISIFPDDGKDAETLIKNADTAMYCAKENGRNKYKFFEPAMNVRAVQRYSIETSLRQALERQEFVLQYQPKLNLSSGMIVGVEALVRWQHPNQQLVLPDQFVPIAEDSGLILPIGRWVLRAACLQIQAWKKAGLPPISVAVNTSALEFYADDFLYNIQATLEDTGIKPDCLELELTESVLMRDAEFTNSVLDALADLGVKLAIDDFGTGYSSLSYLRQFPINTLKIDKSFVNKMINSPDDASIVSAIISLGKTLKLRVIAEGVETAEQLALLQAQQCDEVQGYYLGRPMSAEALLVLLQTGVSSTLLSSY